MNGWMKKSMVATVVALTSVTLAGAALADEHGRKGEGQRSHQMTPEKLMERAESRLDTLESKLNITDEQQDAWTTYRAKMLERAERMSEHMQQRREGERERPATAVERLRYMEERGEARLEALREMRVATEAFYAELNEEQREAFDAEHRGKRGEGRKGHHGGKHGAGNES